MSVLRSATPLALGALLAPAAALADATLEVQEKLAWPAYLWIDGEPVGKLAKEHTATVAPGVHEVWLAGDAEGVTTYCHGTVEVAEGATATVVAKPKTCEGLALGAFGDKTAYKGSQVVFRMSLGDEYAYAVSVDGGLEWPIGPARSLNLAPGEHHLVIGSGSDDAVYDRGVVRPAAGETITLTCTGTACLGLLHP